MDRTNELSLLNDSTNIGYAISGSETIRRHHQNLIRKYESLKEEYESLRKKYADLVGSHGNYVSKLELAQEENFRQRKSFEDCVQDRNVAIREKSHLQQQCTAAIRQWDKALRENNELKEQLAKVQHQRDEAMKEINQAMAVRIKATKDMARLTEERNAAVQEYSLIMSERDSVHKEIEKLQEEQSEMTKKSKQLENDKKVMLEEIESLKREIASALFDRDRVLKACNDLREKYGDYVTGINDETTSPTSPSRLAHNFWGSSSSGVSSSWAQLMSKSTNSDLIKSNHILSAASSNSSVSTFSHQQNKLCSSTRLDNIDQANTEIESLRKQVERLQTDLIEAQQEVEVSKRRRDWAFSERDKIVLERESIRTLCDKLRRERDRAVSDLAEALRDSDDIKRQRNEASKELKELKEKIEAQLEKESRSKAQQQQQQQQNSQFGTNNSSRDSAIDADLQEFEIETIDVLLKRDLKSNDWGIKLNGDEKTLFVSNVVKDSVADGKVKINDCLLKINDNLLTNDLKAGHELLKKADCQLNLTLQRKKATRFVQTINYSIDNGQEHGIVLENGYYVSRINAGSVAAKEGNLAIGDRVLYINGKPIDTFNSYDVMQTLHSSSNIVLQIMKNINNCSQSNSSSSSVNNSKTNSESSDSKCSHQRERQRKMVSTKNTQTEDCFASPPRPPVPLGYQSLSRTSGERNSALISAANKGLISSFTNSSTSSSPGQEVAIQSPPAPTLLDKAYNKIFGDRKQSSKPKQQIQGFPEDESKTLAELDKVLDKYSGGKTYNNGKYSKSKSKKEKNGGTWPKYRGHPPAPSLQNYGNVNAVTTLHPIKRKERKSLGIFSNSNTKPDKLVTANSVQSSANSSEQKKSSDNSIKDESMTPSSLLIFEPASEAALIDYHHHSKRNPNLSSRPTTLQTVANNNQKSSPQSYNPNKSETLDLKLYRPFKSISNSPLDYSVVSAQSKDKNVLDYYKHRANVKQTRPHSVHDVLTDVSEPMSPTTLSLTSNHSAYDSFHGNASSPTPNNVPIPPIRNYAYYALNNLTHAQPGLLHVHHNHYSTASHITRGTPQTAIRHSTNLPPNLISSYISRSGDSLLSGNEHPLHSHESTHARSVSAYQGSGRPYTVKDNLVNRYSITPSPSPSQYSGGLFGGPSPSHSMDIVTTATSGAHFHNLQSKRLVAPQHTHQSHLHHSSINTSNTGGYRSDENNFGISSMDGLSTFPKRNQRFRIPSNPSVTSKSSGGKLSTSSIDKASSSILSDRGSPMPCSYHVEWLSDSHSGSSNGSHRTVKAGDQRSIVIEKSSEPLGININYDTALGGVFVCYVKENSLAAQAGLMVGDQLLEICGINMRNANYDLAANVLRQCSDTISVKVQYNPDKCKETEEADSDDGDVDADVEDDDMEDEDEDDTAANDSSSTSTPQSSPIEHSKPIIVRSNNNNNEEENIPSSATSTLTRSKAASRSASNASRNTEKTLTNYSINERQSSNSFKQSSNACEPRRIILKKTSSNLGITLFGGNAVGIFIHSVRDDSLANGPNGLKPGDQILEYNGVDLRNATAEEAAIELAKPAETVALVTQYNMERYIEIQDQHTGDSFYIRAAFDRHSIDGSLAFRKDDILFVDNTMFNGVPGLWRAWLVDQEGQKVKCGVIPSKYKVEEELLMRRSLTDNSGDRSVTSARRSFFRRRKNNHQRSSSRESTKELASFSDVSINSCSESGAITAEALDQLLPATYIRVERLSYETTRPVIIIGPLMEVLFDKLEQDFPQTFQRCIPEVMRGSQQMMERWLQDLKLVDYRRRGSHFECTTISAVKEICDRNLHALLDVSPTSVERLNRCHIYPVVVYLKFKSTKQIKEIKDHRYPNEKLTTKAAKEMYEHSLKIESEYKDLINVIIPGSNLSYMCTQVKTCVDDEQNKALWV